MDHDPRFLEGSGCSTTGNFYKAHDPWESLWLERFGEEKDFIQGLILSTVALHHYSRGNLGGAPVAIPAGARQAGEVSRHLLGRRSQELPPPDERDHAPPAQRSRAAAARRENRAAHQTEAMIRP
jgi:hypothetical protein